MAAPDAIIVGGGIMGCTVALELAERGMHPLVLERSVPGAEASSAAAGILGPGVESHAGGLSLELGTRSRERYATLAEKLREVTGIDVGFRRCGVMIAALDDNEARALADRAAMLAGAGVNREVLDGTAAREREPRLSPHARAAIDLPEEAQIDPPLLLKALALAAEKAGARFHTGAYVDRVLIEGDRARGVLLDGERVEADTVVVAAGSWTQLVGGLDLKVGTVRPVRGQIVLAETRPPVFRRIVFGTGGYVVTRPDGRTLCGSTMENVGYEREVTLGGLEVVTRTAIRLAPSLAGAPVRGYWSSFRPGTSDDLPLIGSAGPRGLWLATGHYRNGILLAPITAALVSDMITGRPPELDVATLDPRRFAGKASA